jgi:hypothetical protein
MKEDGRQIAGGMRDHEMAKVRKGENGGEGDTETEAAGTAGGKWRIEKCPCTTCGRIIDVSRKGAEALRGRRMVHEGHEGEGLVIGQVERLLERGRLAGLGECGRNARAPEGGGDDVIRAGRSRRSAVGRDGDSTRLHGIRAFADHVGGEIEGYEAGDGGSSDGAWVGGLVSASRAVASGVARPGISVAEEGDFRSRLFLAPSWLRGGPLDAC